MTTPPTHDPAGEKEERPSPFRSRAAKPEPVPKQPPQSDLPELPRRNEGPFDGLERHGADHEKKPGQPKNPEHHAAALVEWLTEQRIIAGVRHGKHQDLQIRNRAGLYASLDCKPWEDPWLIQASKQTGGYFTVEAAQQPLKQLVSVWHRLREHGQGWPVVESAEWGADMEVMGALNGVIELRTGKLLTGIDAAEKLVPIPMPKGSGAHKAKTPPLRHYRQGIGGTLGAPSQVILNFARAYEPKVFAHIVRAYARALFGHPQGWLHMSYGRTKGGKTTLHTSCLSALGPYSSYTAQMALTGDHYGDIKWSPDIFVPVRASYVNDVTGALSEEAIRYLTDGGFQPRTLKGITTYSDFATATTFLSFNPETLTSTGISQEANARRTVPAEFAQLGKDIIDGAMLGEMTHNIELAEHMLALIVAEHTQMTFGAAWPWGKWVEGLVDELIEAETQDHMAWMDRFIKKAEVPMRGVEYGWDNVILAMKAWGIVDDNSKLVANEKQLVTGVWLAGQAKGLPKVAAVLKKQRLDSRRHGTRFGGMEPLPMPPGAVPEGVTHLRQVPERKDLA